MSNANDRYYNNIGNNEERISRRVSLAIFLLYGIVMCWLYSNTKALVPDEVWFLNIAKREKIESLREFFLTPNYLGYGSLYWQLVIAIKNVFILRIFAYILLMIVPISLIIIFRSVMERSWHAVAFMLIFYMTMPFSWYTGKIIGPELLGNALGVAGVTLYLFNKRLKINRLLVSGIFIGLSAGVKMYNAIFFVFILCAVLLSENTTKKIVKISVLLFVGFIFGVVIANPIMLADYAVYKSNIVSTFDMISAKKLYNVLFNNCIEWDLTNSSGLCNTFVPIISLVILVYIGIKEGRENRINIAVIISVLVLILLYSFNTRVLGWYFLPVLFFFPMLISNKKVYIIVIIVNLAFNLGNIEYQIANKISQISYINNEEDILKYTESIAAEEPEYEDIYMIDVGLKMIPMYSAYKYFDNAYRYKRVFYNDETYFGEDVYCEKPFPPQLLFISDKALSNSEIKKIYEYAVAEKEGFILLDTNENLGIYSILHT